MDLNELFLNENMDLNLKKETNNYGELKIRASGNFLLTMFNTFDRMSIYKFCEYNSYSYSYLDSMGCA